MNIDFPKWMEMTFQSLAVDTPAIMIHVAAIAIAVAYRKRLRRIALMVVAASAVFLAVNIFNAFFHPWLSHRFLEAKTLSSDDYYFIYRFALMITFVTGTSAHALLLYAVFKDRLQTPKSRTKIYEQKEFFD